ncbi:GntR family transcriptional regulator [Amycolatopsis cihanbeyliensis]|uniref:GntR family transcriptional regulator n=1 Tax=Amycolatopsis cihanbeyliensis TaxID=1128664 RepID=A0A542DJZ3_AMYCI|nr:PLP-dependent aminotransferase family protein [Amycolatopsis cihanbeyliensis]TQJ03400.1 GntR family transcriptional regulator [Amycolatopsis cihanbeyliensis]
MNLHIPPGGRISGPRLASLLGVWRRGGSRRGAGDLAAAVELQVLDGQLPLGTRLPAERELAEALGVSRTLVATALDQLRAGGIVASRRGSGSWVTAPGGGGLPPAPRSGEDLIDLARAAPPALPGLMGAVDAARRRLCAELTGHGYTGSGLLVLRERIAQRYTARGLPTTPAQVMITNGGHHGFVLALRMLVGPGDRVLVEQPTYPNAVEAIRSAHALPVPVGVNGDVQDGTGGWDLDGMEAALRQAAPRLGYFIVDFHNPTGLRLDTEGRRRLGAALARTRTPVVVDECLAELDLEGDPPDGPAPLGAFGGDWVISVGTAAKTHWGGLRLGWLRASEELISRLQATRYALDLGSPVFEQLVLAELLADPEPMLRRRRAELRTQRDELAAAVRAECPEWDFQLPSGGLSLWCRLPERMSTRLAVAAGNHGVQVVPGSRFAAHGGLESWLRLPYTEPAERLRDAVRRLSAAAASLRAGAAPAGPSWDVPVA